MTPAHREIMILEERVDERRPHGLSRNLPLLGKLGKANSEKYLN